MINCESHETDGKIVEAIFISIHAALVALSTFAIVSILILLCFNLFKLTVIHSVLQLFLAVLC